MLSQPYVAKAYDAKVALQAVFRAFVVDQMALGGNPTIEQLSGGTYVACALPRVSRVLFRRQ